ncbi:hypothetical protein TNCV_1163301 [Trichonephila clavipes]|nr:hypothetical protein TNCV_1163301 [Trichonephila clavipes]
MNPIEHVWDALGRRVAGCQPPRQTLQELKRAFSINRLGFDTLEFSPYCPDLYPSDFHILRPLQGVLKDRQFDSKWIFGASRLAKNTFYKVGIWKLVAR